MQAVTEFTKSILVIEPSESVRKKLIDFLSLNYICEEADCIGIASEKISERNFDIVLSNYNLEDSNALELLASLQFLSPITTVILMGEKDSTNDVIQAFRTGAFDYLQRPFELDELEDSIGRAIIRCKTKRLKESYEERLEEVVNEKNAKLGKALEDVEHSYRATLKVLVQALETRDCETHGHSERVVTFSLRLGHELGLEEKELQDLEFGSLLHDIGKIGVPDSILRKPAKLTELEWDKMKLHPMKGYKILRNIPFLRGAATIVAEHHERWDGKGYPNQLRGEEIAFIARIFAVADAFDAMVSTRVYSKGITFEDAVGELEKNAGTQFDPVVVEAFKQVPKEDWEALRIRSQNNRTEFFSSQEIVSEMVNAQTYFEMVH